MSAIFGIINKNGNPVDPALIEKMQASLLHRAVDGKAVYADGPMMFGHHKLNVHRRQKNEQQPLVLDELVITCDARIDNIDELFAELQLTKTTETYTDPYVILQAYKRWGNDCVKHLEGEFCFAVWNKRTKVFYCGNDHVGYRTVYYAENEEYFAFSSMIASLHLIQPLQNKVNQQIFINYYSNVKSQSTYSQSINILPAAHSLIVRYQKTQKLHYWKLGKIEKKQARSIDWSTLLIDVLSQKIKRSIDTDYPVGILLSGGLDSSLIASIACRLLNKQGKKLLAFCSVLPEDYDGEDKDERHYINRLKDEFNNLEVHYVSIPSEKGPFSNLKKTFFSLEEPPNAFHYVESSLFEAAKKMNVRTLLTGYGGDMAVSNNGSGALFSLLAQCKFKLFADLFIKRYHKTGVPLTKFIKAEILYHFAWYRMVKSWIKKDDDFLYMPLNDDFKNKLRKYEGEQPTGCKVWFQESINRGNIGMKLTSFRKHANAFEIELSSPLLCKDVCELFMGLPEEILIAGGVKRSFIREAMKGWVPNEIRNRKDKVPFSPDYNNRIASINKDFIEEIFKENKADPATIGLDYEMLNNLISDIHPADKKTEWYINEKIYYIPSVIIAYEFNEWLSRNQ